MIDVPLIVIDNFFETPTLVRQFALQQEYFKGDRGNWPGVRTKFIDELDNPFFHTLCSKLIHYIPGANSFSLVQSTFQLIDETYGNGWVHNDDPKFNVAGLVYLNPEISSQNTGTTLYDTRCDVNSEEYTKMFMSEVNSDDTNKRTEFEKYRNDHRSSWTPNAVIENRFNRCILFNSEIWHSADNFFGKDKETARLTLVFFGVAI